MNLEVLLRNGAGLRANEKSGFYVVKQGTMLKVDQDEAMKLVKARKVIPEGKNQWGVMFFALAR